MKIVYALLFVFCFFSSQAQMPRTQVFKVNAHDWSNEAVFEISPAPIIKGFGVYSDSLSNQFGGTFYAFQSDYYRIVTWADYYYWFTKKYSQFFSMPLLYEYYYNKGDNIGMASYIASHRYLGKFYPTVFQISFDGGFLNNRLGTKKYLALTDKQVNRFNKALAEGAISNHYPNSQRAAISPVPRSTSERRDISHSPNRKSPARIVATKQVLDQ